MSRRCSHTLSQQGVVLGESQFDRTEVAREGRQKQISLAAVSDQPLRVSRVWKPTLPNMIAARSLGVGANHVSA